MKNKKALLALLSILPLVSACGSTASSSKPSSNPSATASTSSNQKAMQISLWESHAGGPVANAMAAIVKKFNHSQNHVVLKLNITKASKKAMAAVVAHHPPLFAEISHYDNPFIKAHALMNLDAMMKTLGFQAKAFYPGVWLNGEFQGVHYRFPADTKVEEFFYNKSLFKKANIKSTPKTWNQLAVDLKKLQPLHVIPMAFKDSSAHILSAFIANGGHFYSNNKHSSVNFNNAAGKTTFTYFANLYSKKRMILAHGANIRADFGAQKLAIADGTSAGYQKILSSANGKFKVGAFALPAGTSGHAGNIIQGLGFVIFTGHSKQQQKAALQFVKYFNSPAIQAYWAMHSGFAPNSLASAAAISKTWLKSHPGEAVSIHILSATGTLPRPNNYNYKEVNSALDTAFFQAVTGKTSTAKALASLNKKANAYLSGQSKL